MSRLSTYLLACTLTLASTAGLMAQNLLLPETSAEIADQEIDRAGGDVTIDLSAYFRFLIANGVNGEVARFTTVLGVFDAELRTDWAPKHVANFKAYVAEGRYANTIIHRTVNTEDFAIVQGGGFTNGIPPARLASHDPVNLEYRQFNLRGTLAAARLDYSPDSATTGWYFNVTDNTEQLGRAVLDGLDGYTVFGGVLSSGMEVVDAISKLDIFNLGGAFAEIPLVDYDTATAPPVVKENFVTVSSIAMVPHYPATPGGPGALTFTASSNKPNVLGASISGRNLVLDPNGLGTATITVVASDIRGYELTQMFDVTVASSVVISAQPVSRTVAPGGSTTFFVTASSDEAMTYQWYKNNTAIPGATSSSLALSGLSDADNGGYHVAITAGGSVQQSLPAYLLVATPNSGRIVNESVNTTISPGTSLTVGFAVEGGSKTMLIRGMGPSLAQPPFNMPSVQNNLSMSLFQAGNATPLETNVAWGENAAILAAAESVGAFEFKTPNDAAILRTMSVGSYTAVLSATGANSGVAIMEAYATDPGNTSEGRLVNLSALKRIDNANPSLTAGFAISGNVPKQVVLRAAGPSIVTVAPGLDGQVLLDPTLTLNRLISASGLEPVGVVLSNDNWQDEGNWAQTEAAAQVTGAFPLLAGGNDAAVVVTLPPGNYTVSVGRKGTQVGAALIEVYEVP